MKAFVYSSYGNPDVLKWQDVPRPEIGPRELLIRIQAAAVNDYDWAMVSGKPGIYRLFFGLFRPRHPTPGMELAGTVEEAGAQVELLQKGDKVYGDLSDHGFGAYAEFICVNERAVRRMPAAMSFIQAAAIPHASLLAYQGLVELGRLHHGERLLINGAGGGVGTFGLQIAKEIGAHVTGVDSGPKLKAMMDLGFDEVIDYKIDDFSKNGQSYDLILDCKTTRSPFTHARSLNPGGRYVTVGGTVRGLLSTLFLGWMVSLFNGKSQRILALRANQGLEIIEELFAKGKIRPVIDGPHPMQEAARQLRRFGAGEHSGKIVLEN